MPIQAMNAAAGTLDHVCAVCHCVQTGLRIDPAAGEVAIRGENLVPRACPQCGSEEHLRLDHAPWEEGRPWQDGDPLPPGSLVGQLLPLDNGLSARVTHHAIGWHSTGTRATWVRLHRALARHPHLAPHLPPALRDRLTVLE